MNPDPFADFNNENYSSDTPSFVDAEKARQIRFENEFKLAQLRERTARERAERIAEAQRRRSEHTSGNYERIYQERLRQAERDAQRRRDAYTANPKFTDEYLREARAKQNRIIGMTPGVEQPVLNVDGEQIGTWVVHNLV